VTSEQDPPAGAGHQFRGAGAHICTHCGEQLGGVHRDDGHFTAVVAPILVALSIPTVTLIVTTQGWPINPSRSFRVTLAALFIASSGLLLAGTQCSLGRVSRVVPAELRAVMTYGGLFCLVAGLILMLIPLLKHTSPLTMIVSIVAIVILALAAVIPTGIRVYEYFRCGRTPETGRHG
jgi:hypothetical protein